MLPLPLFRHHAPTRLEEVVALLAELGPRARLIAGGTDLLPNMKHGLLEPEHLISLRRVEGLRGVTAGTNELRIGAMTPLAEVAADAAVRADAAALGEAAASVGGPHHRRMGTLGGNVCLDTRCLYFNQTHFWREALGFCLKKDGSACHVVASGQSCVAAASNDSAPALIALGARVVVHSASGERVVEAGDFYTPDGIHNTVLGSGDVVTAVLVPKVAGRRSSFEKLRRRGAIDFPLLDVAARVDRDGDRIASLALVVSTLAARPRAIQPAARRAAGEKLDDALVAELGELAYKQCRPLSNVDGDVDWRRQMVRVLVRKALGRLAEPIAR
jgi:4-hydroxybenzoyl-CoA reductase subunit beta